MIRKEWNMNETVAPERQICGRSFLGSPMELIRLGTGKTAVLFCAGFGGQRQSAQLLECFLKDLQDCAQRALSPVGKINVSWLFSARSLYFCLKPNPDATDIIEHRLPADSPFLPRINRLCGKTPQVLWSSNGRGVDPACNFNYRFAQYKARGVSHPAPFGYCGSFPESEPESASFARLARTLRPRLFVHVTHGQGALAFPDDHAPLKELCMRYAPFEQRHPDFSASPEGWMAQELGTVCLRITADGEKGDYSLLRPLLFALSAY